MCSINFTRCNWSILRVLPYQPCRLSPFSSTNWDLHHLQTKGPHHLQLWDWWDHHHLQGKGTHLQAWVLLLFQMQETLRCLIWRVRTPRTWYFLELKVICIFSESECLAVEEECTSVHCLSRPNDVTFFQAFVECSSFGTYQRFSAAGLIPFHPYDNPIFVFGFAHASLTILCCQSIATQFQEFAHITNDLQNRRANHTKY